MYTISNYNMKNVCEIISEYISEHKGSVNLKEFNKARRAQKLLQNLLKAKGTSHAKVTDNTDTD